MKKFGIKLVLIAISFSIVVVITAFTYKSGKQYVIKDFTNYYWYDASGNYLWRQNTIDNEISLTGFDEFPYSPYTLQEKGYAPVAVSGYPPAPIDPNNPTKRLYSHP